MSFADVLKVGVLGGVVAWATGALDALTAGNRVTLAPGTLNGPSGMLSFFIPSPSGPAGWIYATKTSASAGVSELVFQSESATHPLGVNLAAGEKVDIDWRDSAGANQHTTYTAQ
jgi:hypothetical protein